MPNKVTLEWNGEVVKQKVSVPDMDVSPKMILDSLDQANGEIDKMKGELTRMEQQKVQLNNNIKSAEAFVKDRRPFEEKSIEIQLDKLKLFISKITKECKVKAEEMTNKTIAESPDAYTEQQKKNMFYVNYQRLLATDKNIANKIARRVISEHLFEKPIFDNPF